MSQYVTSTVRLKCSNLKFPQQMHSSSDCINTSPIYPVDFLPKIRHSAALIASLFIYTPFTLPVCPSFSQLHRVGN